MLGGIRNTALATALVLIALFVASCGGGGEDETPAEVLARATLQGVSSGTVDLVLSAEAGGKGEELDVSISGPFRSNEGSPEFGLAAQAEGRVEGESIDFEGGLTLLEDRAFLTYEGDDYEIDPETFDFAIPSLLPVAPGGLGAPIPALTACVEAAAEIDAAGVVKNPTAEGSVDVDGTSTTKVGGDLDSERAADAILELSRNSACAAQLREAGQSPRDLEAIADDLTGTATAHLEIDVGDDDIVRRIAGEVAAEPKGGDRGAVRTEFELTLGQVNEEPKIDAPDKSKSIELWLAKVGVQGFGAAVIFSEAEALGRLLELAAADAFPGLRL